MSLIGGMMGSDEDTGKDVKNLIRYFIPDDTMRALMYNCLRVDIPDNNIKAEVVKEILGTGFEEIGTGTNRIAFRYNGLVIKVALDRRGQVDNLMEFKRSIELPEFLAKTYETNYLINIAEYVDVIEQDKFEQNEVPIKEILSRLSENYLFDDVGFTMKNSYNWGARETFLTPDDEDYYGDELEGEMYDIVILDYGYLYPLYGQKDSLMKCPKCDNRIRWNSNYTGLLCTNSQCMFQISPTELRLRMDLDYEELENKLMADLNSQTMPNLVRVEQALNKINKGEIEDDIPNESEVLEEKH